MKMRLFSLCYGEPYVTWFEQGLMRSLLWPKNLEAIRAHAAEFNIYTRDEDRDRLRAAAAPLGIEIQFHPYRTMNSSGETLQPCILDHLKNCLQTGHAVAMTPPDTIFGDGTWATLCNLGSLHGLCIALPHVRVNAGALGALPQTAVSNAQLVKFAFDNLHPTWRDANAELQNTNSFMGGVSWRRLADGLWAVTHRLPTCYLANIDISDVEWFTRQYETGVWDHTWPERLVKAQRHRMIGSSDAAFAVELTREHENIPPVQPSNPQVPDHYWRDLEHNYTNRNTVAIFRSE